MKDMCIIESLFFGFGAWVCYRHTPLSQSNDSSHSLKMKNHSDRISKATLDSTFSAGHSSSRDEISLNGEWEILFDPDNKGRSRGWHLDTEFEKQADRRAIKVPSAWETIEKDYEGVAFYRKKFFAPAEWEGKIVHINFDAVNYLSEVWLNNSAIDYHEGGFTPFSFRIDKTLDYGNENVVTLRVVGPIILTDQFIDTVGRFETVQWRGGLTGGIWQDVKLSATDLVLIEDVFIETDIVEKSASFSMGLNSLLNRTSKVSLNLFIEDSEGKTVVEKESIETLKPGENLQRWSFKISDAILWSLDNPYLYTAKLVVCIEGEKSDSWKHAFGFRRFTLENGKFTFNNAPIYLKAVFFEGLYPTSVAAPEDEEVATKEILLAKEAGFNMIRPWRKPPTKMWLDLCDRLGVLVVGTLATECMGKPLTSPYLKKRVEHEARASIVRDRNRTCVVQWELFGICHRYSGHR